MGRSQEVKNKPRFKSVFVSGTDTGIGKTVVSFVLGTLLQEQAIDVGVMKPIQCAGEDAFFLKKLLQLKDSLREINPYYAKEPLSPHLAFRRQKIKIDINKIIRAFYKLQDKHEVLLVEGAGGLLVPIKDNYCMADLILDLNLDLVIVSRLGLGTINHTLLTINQARDMGIRVKGVIFNKLDDESDGIVDKTNPGIIRRLGKVPILGIIPYLKRFERKEVQSKCLSIVDLFGIFEENNTSRDKQLIDWDKKYVWHPFTQMQDWLREEPLVIDRAKGCFLVDTEGNSYIDGVSSLWVNVHGHGKKEIDTAIKAQVNRVSHSTLLGLSNTPAIELAKELVDIAPDGLDKVFYSDNGSTSVEVAIKIAYQFWRNTGHETKKNIVHLANSYHGDTLGSVSVGGIDLFGEVYRDITFKTIKVHFPDFYRTPRNKIYPAYTEECLKKIEELFKKRSKSIAAFVIEPLVQGAAGMIVWPQGVLKRIRVLCARYNILLIADEVATGFGRTGKMFACNHERVVPDFLCLAKGLTGGYLPLAATLTTRRIFDGFLFDYKEKKTFFHGHTFTGNPLCCAAALANIRVFKKEQTLKRIQPKISFLGIRLKAFYNLKHVGDIRQKGLMVGIELVKNKATKEPYQWDERIGVKVCQDLKAHGVILRPLGNVIVLMPPLAITMNQLSKLLDVIYPAINKVTRATEQS